MLKLDTKMLNTKMIFKYPREDVPGAPTSSPMRLGNFRGTERKTVVFFSRRILFASLFVLRWLNRVMQDHEARASYLNRKLIFSFFLLFS